MHGERTAGGPPPDSRWGVRVFASGFVIALGLLLGACPEEPTPMGQPVDTTDGATSASPFLSCEPGEELACTCTTGQPGVQVCADDGASASGCTCSPLPDPDPGFTTLPPDPTNGDGDTSTGDDGTADTADTAGDATAGSGTASDSGDTGTTAGSDTSGDDDDDATEG